MSKKTFLFTIYSTYSWKKPAMAIRLCSSRFIFSSALSESWNVEGSMFGNIFNAKGKANSMNGIMTNILIGTNLKRSAVVRRSCFLSLLVSGEPFKVRDKRRLAVRTSAASNLKKQHQSELRGC